MKYLRTLLQIVFVLMLLVILDPGSSQACPNCYSDPNAPTAQGMKMAVISLLGVTGGVLMAFGSFFLFLRRRSLMIDKLFSNRFN